MALVAETSQGCPQKRAPDPKFVLRTEFGSSGAFYIFWPIAGGLTYDRAFGGPPMHSSSSRAHRPIRHTVHVACQVVRERDFRLVADRVVNLSLDGMLVAPADPVLTGEKIIVSFPSPVDGRWIDAEATVTRVLHGRRPGEYRRALGLAFETLDDPSRRVLEEGLQQIPPAPPGTRGWTPHARRVPKGLVREGARPRVATCSLSESHSGDKWDT
jgi:hypothetical protein